MTLNDYFVAEFIQVGIYFCLSHSGFLAWAILSSCPQTQKSECERKKQWLAQINLALLFSHKFAVQKRIEYTLYRYKNLNIHHQPVLYLNFGLKLKILRIFTLILKHSEDTLSFIRFLWSSDNFCRMESMG